MTDPHAYFAEATAALDPDVESLVSGGLERGRARRRRRQLLTSAAAGAAVAVLAVGAVAVPRLMSADAPLSPAGQRSEGRALDPLPAPTTPAEPQQTGPREIAVTPDEAPAVFAGILGGEVEVDQAYPGDHGGVAAHFHWDGAATSLFVDGFTGDRAPLQECRAHAAEGMECTARPDGSAELRWQQTAPAADGGSTGRSLSLFTTDGWALEVISYNAADPKSSVLLSPEPPASFADLEQVVTSDRWFTPTG